MTEDVTDLPCSGWRFSEWLGNHLEQRGWDWDDFSRRVAKPGRAMRRLKLGVALPPPNLATCGGVARALGIPLLSVIWHAWVQSPVGDVLQRVYLTHLFTQLADEDQERILAMVHEMTADVKAELEKA